MSIGRQTGRDRHTFLDQVYLLKHFYHFFNTFRGHFTRLQSENQLLILTTRSEVVAHVNLKIFGTMVTRFWVKVCQIRVFFACDQVSQHRKCFQGSISDTKYTTIRVERGWSIINQSSDVIGAQPSGTEIKKRAICIRNLENHFF